jgi:methionine sulfoxide reductase heme-binding subunit
VSAAAAVAGSQGLWYASRASGLTLLAAFTAVLVLGTAARTGMTASAAQTGTAATAAGAAQDRPGSRFVAAELHRALALFAVAFLILHVATALLDPYVTIGWAATLLPLASAYRPLAIGLGALAVDLGGAVLVTSLIRRRLGYRAWRAVHWLAYLAWPAAFAHSLTAGNDLRIWWVALLEWGCGAAAATAVLARLLQAARDRSAGGRPAAARPPRALRGSREPRPVGRSHL